MSIKQISHRGNIYGVNKDTENNPHHIQKLLNHTLQVEIDVWYIRNNWFLGHDYPQYQVDLTFLLSKGLWCHAKNLNSLYYMLKHGVEHCFWHQEDDYTLTSSGFIWTFPNKAINDNCIIVDLNPKWKLKNYKCWAVCTDFIEETILLS